MKYIDADLLRKEIERQMEELREAECMYKDTFIAGARKAYGLLLAFLDTLPEQPVEGLEEEIDEYVKKQWDMLTSTDSTKSIVRRIARHFAEWGAEHLKR